MPEHPFTPEEKQRMARAVLEADPTEDSPIGRVAALIKEGRMSERARRLDELVDEVGLDEDALDDLADQRNEPLRWALVEEYRMPRRNYITLHETAKEASEYHTSQEDPFWYPSVLVDLDVGSRHAPRFTLGWEGLRDA